MEEIGRESVPREFGSADSDDFVAIARDAIET